MRLLSTEERGYGMSQREGSARALIVEDDPDSREAMRQALRRLGFDADCAGTFLEGVAKLTPDVRWLILDLRLPDGDGATLLRYIRQHDWPVGVAVVTGADDDMLLTDAVLLKPDAFFTKPVDFGDVARWMFHGHHRGADGEGSAGSFLPT
jgi:two-component system, OmpR family, response regulator QseB